MLKLLQKIKITRDCFKQENNLKCNTSMHKAYSSLFCTVLDSPIKAFATYNLQDSSSPPLPQQAQADYEYSPAELCLENSNDLPDAPLSPNKSRPSKTSKILQYYSIIFFLKPNKKPTKQVNKNI